MAKVTVPLFLCSFVTAVGCQEDPSAAPATATAAAKTTATAAATGSAKLAADTGAKLDLVEKDLGPAGAAWKGWVAKGPADADVLEDLGGARIVTKKVSGPGAFDLAFKLAKPDIRAIKEGAQKGAELAKGKVTFTADGPDGLEWMTEIGAAKSYGFAILVRVAGKEATCYTVTPRESEAEIEAHKDACRMLDKR